MHASQLPDSPSKKVADSSRQYLSSPQTPLHSPSFDLGPPASPTPLLGDQSAPMFEPTRKTKNAVASTDIGFRVQRDDTERDPLARDNIVEPEQPETSSYYHLSHILMGMLCGLALIVCLRILFLPLSERQIVKRMLGETFPVFRAFLLPMELAWLWVGVVAIFEKYDIPYEQVFNMAVKSESRVRSAWNVAVRLSVAVLVGFFLYIAAVSASSLALFGLSQKELLGSIVITLSVIVLWPAPLRQFLAATLLQIVVAPFGRVTFLENFAADLITSMSRTLFDLHYTFFYIGPFWLVDTGEGFALPFLAAIPLYWRLMQCLRGYYNTRLPFPHLVNGGKYFSSLVVVVYGRLHGNFAKPVEWTPNYIAWLVLFIFSTLYSFAWDLWVDWHLFEPQSQQSVNTWHIPSLRKTRFFPNWVYYYMILSNFLLRFVWTLTISPLAFHTKGLYHEAFVFLVASLEIFRRSQWSIVRIESEIALNRGRLALPAHLVD